MSDPFAHVSLTPPFPPDEARIRLVDADPNSTGIRQVNHKVHLYSGVAGKKLHSFWHGKDLRRQLTRGGLGVAAVQAFNRILALALGIVLARGLGPGSYGVYAYAFAIMSLLMVLAEAGVPTLLMREVAAAQGRAEWGLLRGALRRGGQFVALVSITVSLSGLLVLTGFASRLTPAAVYTAALMLILLPATALTKTLTLAMQGLHRVVIGQTVNMLLRPLLVILFVSVVFVLWPGLRKPQVAMAAQLAAALIALIVGGWALRRCLPAQARENQPVYRSRLWLKSALPFTLIGGAAIINNQADIMMLGWLRPAAEVGVYRVAVQGSVLVAFSLQAVTAVTAPHFARLHAQEEFEKLQRLVTQSARVIFFVALPVACTFVIAGGAILCWVFGADYVPAYLPLAILAVGQLVNAAFGPVGFLLNMTGNESVAARSLWQTVMLNIAMNAVLVPTFGMTGAAAASTISVIAWNVLLYRQVKKRLAIQPTII